MNKYILTLLFLAITAVGFSAENDVKFMYEDSGGGFVEGTLPADESQFLLGLPSVTIGSDWNTIAKIETATSADIIISTELNATFADPSTNGSFSASEWRSDLDLEIGTDIQAYDAGIVTKASSVMFIDGFDRADTADNSIGTGETGQAWTITGSGAANVRLTDQALGLNASAGTFYAWPDLSFNVRRFGCTFVYEADGAASYVQAMILSKADQSLTDMLHITWNANTIGVQDWRGGAAGDTIVTSIVFTEPLQVGKEYTVEVEIIPELDKVILYSPDGQVGEGTHPNVSEYNTPYAAWESSENVTPVYTVGFKKVWALADSASGDFIALAASMSPRADFDSAVQLNNSTGRVNDLGFGSTGTTTINSDGTITAIEDSDGEFTFGRVNLGSVSVGGSDLAAFGHVDQFTTAGLALRQNGAGTTILNSAAGSAYISIGGVAVVNVNSAYFYVASDTDFTSRLGRVGLFSRTSDEASFSHLDHASATNFVLSQTASGQVYLNAPSGDTIQVYNNGTALVAEFSEDGVRMKKQVRLDDSTTATDITADDQAVATTGRSFIRLSSDSVTATDRTFTLAAGSHGQMLILKWVDASDAGELADSGTVQLSAAWTPNNQDMLTLIYDGSDAIWTEISRSSN